MAPTTSSRPRQIEEESDVGVPNLPIVRPDREDEDGENESRRLELEPR
jgi:hypothetical protein